MKQFKSLFDLKINLDETFCAIFFSRRNSLFHKDKSKYWSKTRQILVITRIDGSKVEYKPVFEENKLTLRLVK